MRETWSGQQQVRGELLSCFVLFQRSVLARAHLSLSFRWWPKVESFVCTKCLLFGPLDSSQQKAGVFSCTRPYTTHTISDLSSVVVVVNRSCRQEKRREEKRRTSEALTGKLPLLQSIDAAEMR